MRVTDAKHTPEPWRYRKMFADDPAGKRGNWIAGVVSSVDRTGGWVLVSDAELAQELEDDVRRIVACVNACAGIPTERLEEGVVREMAALLEAVVPPEGDDEWWCPTCEEWIPGGRVTAAECCDTCGTYLGGINDPEWVEKARALLAKLRGEA